MIGRRVGSVDEIEQAGDYYGPTHEVNTDGAVIGAWRVVPAAHPLRWREVRQ